MLGLCLPERAGRSDLRHDPPRPQSRCVHVGDRVLGDSPLLVVVVVDGRAIARAHVVPLTVARRRIVDLEEELEQVPIRDLVGIEDDLDRLGMGAVVAVRGVRYVAAA